MEKELEQLMRVQGELKATLAELVAKDSKVHADAIKRDELEKMKTELVEKLELVQKQVAESKMPKDTDEKASAKGLIKFMKAVKSKDAEYLKAQTEGTPADGGLAVPAGMANYILGYLRDLSTIVPKCSVLEHAATDGNVKTIPRWLTGINAAWYLEAGVRAAGTFHIAQATSTLRMLGALISDTEELSADNIVSLDNAMAAEVKLAIDNELERVVLAGDVAGLGDPFNGILYVAGTSSVSQAGGSIGYKDLINLWNNPNVLQRYAVGAEWYMNRRVLAKILDIVDGFGRPIWNMNALDNGVKMSILGSPLNISDQIPNTFGAGGDKGAIVYGNYKNVVIGQKAGDTGIRVDYSNTAIITNTVPGGTVTENAFQQYLNMWRFNTRRSVVVAVPAGFSVMTSVTVV